MKISTLFLSYLIYSSANFQQFWDLVYFFLTCGEIKMASFTVLDPKYLEFLEMLSKPTENLPNTEIQLERKEAERAGQ